MTSAPVADSLFVGIGWVGRSREAVTVLPMSRRTRTVRLAALMLGLAALLLMHGITFPAGHLMPGMDGMSSESSMMTPDAVLSTHAQDASHHSGEDTSHGEMAAACLAAIVSATAVTVVLRSSRRHFVKPERALLAVLAGPEPPVPRLSFAL